MGITASCLGCGSKFTFQPCNSAGKYCSYECMKRHRTSISGSSGLYLRKLLLRAGVHGEQSLLRVYARVRKAGEDERMVIMRDVLMENDAVKAEIKRIASNMTEDERKRVIAECERLERILKKQAVPIVTIDCNVCGKTLPADSGLCYSCGNPVGYNVAEPVVRP